jgi:hypothetical protein
MGRNYGIKYGLFISKMLAIDPVASVFSWKARLAQKFPSHNHNQASSPEPKETYPQETTHQTASFPRLHSNKLIPPSSVHSGNLVHDKDFSALEDSTEKDIFPPPARRPTCNGAPPKSGSTRTQLGKECRAALAAKAMDVTKKEQGYDAKKCASDGQKVGGPAHGLPANFFFAQET